MACGGQNDQLEEESGLHFEVERMSEVLFGVID